MEKKYQVFISSTFIDLKEERQAVVEAILKAGHIPAGMELFKAGKSQLETIKKWIDASDIYVLILGGRYGSIDKETGKSYTQLEYEYALENNIPIFSIVIDEEVTKEKVKHAKNHEDVIEVYNKDKYDNFKKIVQTKIVAFTTNLAEIKLSIHENIRQFENEYDLKGWIKSDNLKNNDKLQEKYINLVDENNNLKSQIEILKSKDKDKKMLKSGLSYDEMKTLLISRKIIIHKEYLNEGKNDMIITLIDAFLSGQKSFSYGVSNSHDMNLYDQSLYFDVAPELITLGLLENNGNQGRAYRTTTLTEDGKKFITLYKLEEMKKTLKLNI